MTSAQLDETIRVLSLNPAIEQVKCACGQRTPKLACNTVGTRTLCTVCMALVSTVVNSAWLLKAHDQWVTEGRPVEQ